MKKYYKHTIKNIVQIKNIVTIEYLELPVDYVYPSEKHEFWELVYIDKGSIFYYIDGAPTFMSEGDLFFLSPYQQHSIKGNNERSSNIFVLCFNSVSPFLSMLHNYKTKLQRSEKGILTKLLEEAENTFALPVRKNASYLENSRFGGEQMIKLYMELFLITILRKKNSSKEGNAFFIVDNVAEEIVSSVIAAMKKQVYEKIYIDEICEDIHYSRSYVSKLFKEQTGKSIITYFNELKITEAKKLIRETSCNMAGISDRLNFSDPRYFNLLFKKITKMTPIQYKNSIHRV